MPQPETNYDLEIPYHKTVEELVELTKVKPPACWNAYTALAQNNSVAAIGALEALLINSDWSHTRAAIQAIGNNANGRQLTGRIMGFLDHKNAFIVTAALRALSNLKSREAHNKIMPLVNSENTEIQLCAIESLSNIWQPADFVLLLNMSNQNIDEAIKKRIGFVLAAQVDKSNWGKFYNNYYKDSITRHREWALQFACEFSNERTHIEHFLQDKDGHIRKKAGKFLKNRGSD